MSKSTVANVITMPEIPSVANVLEYAKLAIPAREALRERYSEFVKSEPDFKHAITIVKQLAATGWDDPVDGLEVQIAAHKKRGNDTEMKNAQAKLAVVKDYAEWVAEKNEMAWRLEEMDGFIRSCADAFLEDIGDTTVYKTYIKNGDKRRASGGKNNSGYITRVFRVEDDTPVVHPVTGALEWGGVNDVRETLVGPYISKKSGKKFNQNADVCERSLLKAGYRIEYFGKPESE